MSTITSLITVLYNFVYDPRSTCSSVMTIYKKRYIETDKEVTFDPGNIAYNFTFVVACRYESEGKLVGKS